MRIQLKEMFGTDCVSLDQGDKVYRRVYQELKENRSVEVDFEGITTLYSPFLMGSLGKLLHHFEKTTVMQRLEFRNIQTDHLKTVNAFIDRAEDRFTEHHDAETLKELFEEDELGDL